MLQKIKPERKGWFKKILLSIHQAASHLNTCNNFSEITFQDKNVSLSYNTRLTFKYFSRFVLKARKVLELISSTKTLIKLKDRLHLQTISTGKTLSKENFNQAKFSTTKEWDK